MGMRVSPVLTTLSAAAPVIITSLRISGTLCGEIVDYECKARSLYVVVMQKDNITIDFIHHVVYCIAHFKVD